MRALGDDDYAAAVFDGFKRELLEYTASVVRWRGGSSFSDLRVRIWVVTARTLHLDHAVLFSRTQRLLSEDLPDAVLEDIFYTVDLGTSPPDYSITIEPEPVIDAPEDDDVPTSRGWLLLTLSYQDHEARYHLAPSRIWVPLGRAVTVRPGRMPVRIPNHLHAVPRGPLLLLRRCGPALQVRRSAERLRDYTVFLDGVALHEGDTRNASDTGTITYLGAQRRATQVGYLQQEK